MYVIHCHALKMEAGGIEPPSESPSERPSTCVVGLLYFAG